MIFGEIFSEKLGVLKSDVVKAVQFFFESVLCVRNVISGSGNRSDPIHALIGGACRVCQWPPLAQRHNKRGASRGTETNVRRAHSALTNPNDLRPIKEALKRGDWLTSPPTPDRRPSTLTLTDVMSSSSSAQGTPRSP
jgi:hypothetical protein